MVKFFKAFFIGCCFLPLGLNSQNVQEIMEATRLAYTAHENLSMSVAVLNYSTATTQAGTLVGQGKMCKSKSGYYSRFMNTELVSNKECTIIVDHDSREMTFLPADKKDLKRMGFVASIDSLSKMNDSVVYRGVINGEKLLVFFNPGTYIIRTEVFISNSTSLIDKIVYYYAPETEDETLDAYKTEITYRDISFSEIEENVFSEKRFIEFKDKQWRPVAAYKNFHFTAVSNPKP